MAKNPVGSYRGHTIHSTAGVHKLFGPAGPTLFTGVGAIGKLRSHVDALPEKRNGMAQSVLAGRHHPTAKTLLREHSTKRMNPKKPTLAELDRLFPNYDPSGPEETNFSAVFSVGLDLGLDFDAAAKFADKFNSHRASCGHCLCLPKKNGQSLRMNSQRRIWRVSFSHVDGPLGEKRLRAIVSRWSGQLRASGGDYTATFAAQDDANAAVRQAGAAGFGGQAKEAIVQRKNGSTNPRTRANHHLAVGTPVLSAGHIARITKQLPKDYYTIKYVDTGSLRTVRGSTLNKK